MALQIATSQQKVFVVFLSCHQPTEKKFNLRCACWLYFREHDVLAFLLPLAHLVGRVLLCPAPSVHPSVCPSHPPFHSAAHNTQHKLVIFGTAIDLTRRINPIDYGDSMFIFKDPAALWKFMYTLTDVLLGQGLRGFPSRRYFHAFCL